jgi:hypothetical protein
MLRYERLVNLLARISHDDFLMHGSVRRPRYGVLVPKQPRIVFPNKPELTRKRVYATAVIPVALLYATINLPSAHWDWRFIRDGRSLCLYCRIRGEVTLTDGYIHIVRKIGFDELHKMVIYSSRRRVRLHRTIRVPAGVLPWMLECGNVRLVREYPDLAASRA